MSRLPVPKLWLASVVLILALCVAAILELTLRGEAPQPRPRDIAPAYIPPPQQQTASTTLRFTDVTEASGVRFTHYTGGFARADGNPSRYLPETMGSGVVLFDADGDDDVDVFLVNSSTFPGRDDGENHFPRLYRNDGDLRFADVTAAAGLEFSAYGMGGAAADYDGDGDQDLLVTTWGGPRLFRNEAAGVFREVTAEAGLSSPGWTDEQGNSGPDWSTTAAFFDADQDGDLDLFVANYVRWSPATDVFTTIDGEHKSFTSPEPYRGNSSRLYLQDSPGRFRDATRSSGVHNDAGKSLGVALWDVTGNGRLDVLVANDAQPDFLFENLGGGRFREQGTEAGIAYGENGKARAGMGIDVADERNDGTPAIAVGNFSQEPVSLFRATAPGFFHEASAVAGLAVPTALMLTFGVVFADLDLDGFQDLVLANGHIEPTIQSVQADIAYEQPMMLFLNRGDGRYDDLSKAVGEPFRRPLVGRGLAVADLDGDGDLDLVATANGGAARVLRNDGTGTHYLRVRLRGRAPNTAAIGALVRVEGAGRAQRRLVRTGSSYLSQSELTQTFGLGSETAVDRLVVVWPDGGRTEVPDPPIDRIVTVSQDAAQIGHAP